MANTQKLLQELRRLIETFEEHHDDEDLRLRVQQLLPVSTTLQNLGKSLISDNLRESARSRLLKYFQMYPRVPLPDRELALVAGISEWARRIRELRTEHGWKILSGNTALEMREEQEIGPRDQIVANLEKGDYMLLEEEPDRDAAEKWRIMKEIRNSGLSTQRALLEYFRRNIGRPVAGEELRYVAKDKSEWARRVRELRTEQGWPITTKVSGNPLLPVGVYVLEADRQTPSHDRHIREDVRREALRRDDYRCQKCGWTHENWNRSDPRFLEIHHISPHAHGGTNEPENLITYCNICHDRIHAVDNGN